MRSPRSTGRGAGLEANRTRRLSVATVLSRLSFCAGELPAEQRQATPGSGLIGARSVPCASAGPASPARGHDEGLSPYPCRRYVYRRLRCPTVVAISSFSILYYRPVVVTSAFFCVLHNDAFVTRAGLLDHLSGTHRTPPTAAAWRCPDSAESCMYRSTNSAMTRHELLQYSHPVAPALRRRFAVVAM
jgi:hypothetical protein